MPNVIPRAGKKESKALRTNRSRRRHAAAAELSGDALFQLEINKSRLDPSSLYVAGRVKGERWAKFTWETDDFFLYSSVEKYCGSIKISISNS
jgi:hypothetical protein